MSSPSGSDSDSEDILALDLSGAQTGVAEGRPGEVPRLYSQSFSTVVAGTRAINGRAMQWLLERIKAGRPAEIVAEARINTMWGGTNADTTRILIGLHAIVEATTWMVEIPYSLAPVGTVRRHFIAHGNLNGATAKLLVRIRCRELGWDPPNGDAADAAAVWHWRCSRLALSEHPPAPRDWWKRHVPPHVLKAAHQADGG